MPPVHRHSRFGEPFTQANVSSDGMEWMLQHRPGSWVQPRAPANGQDRAATRSAPA